MVDNKTLKIAVTKKELEILKELINNEVVNFEFVKPKKKQPSKYIEYKNIVNKLQHKIYYASSV